VSTTPPATTPLWANAASAIKTLITAPERAAGFVPGQPATAGRFNSQLNLIGRWIDYLNGPRGAYASLEGAASAMAAGDTVTIFENDTAVLPGDLLAGYRTSGAIYSKIAATSDVIVVAESAAAPTISVFSRSDPGGTALRSFTLTHPSFPTSMTIYGDILAITAGTYVELFTLSTGVSLWSYNHGAAIKDVQVCGAYTVIAGQAGTGTKHGRILQTSNGTLLDSIDHGGTLNACAIYGRNVAFAGAAGTGGVNVRAYQMTGSLVSLWDDVAGTGGEFFTLRTDARNLYGTESGHLYVLSWADGGQLFDVNITGGFVATSQFMAVDQGGVYVCSTDGAATQLQRLALGTCSYVWQSPALVGTQVAVATDGARIWSLNTVGGASARILSFARGNVAGQWTKIDTTITTYNRFGWLLQPGVE